MIMNAISEDLIPADVEPKIGLSPIEFVAGRSRKHSALFPNDLREEEKIPQSLTDAQRELVAQNIGLVGVHLRNRTNHLTPAQRRNQRQDLFQEGCLGLIRAALTHGEGSPIPFAAFALKRIHMYVSRAMLRERCAQHVVHEDSSVLVRESVRSGGGSLGTIHRRGNRLFGANGDTADDDVGREQDSTVGERLREKYERAARNSMKSVRGRVSERGDRESLIRILIEERFLMPDEDLRRGLRQISRDTNSSFARVLKTDRQIADAIRDILRSDPEFEVLQRAAQERASGVATPIDARLEATLAVAGAGELVRRLRNGTSEDRASLFLRLWSRCAEEMAKMSARIFVRLRWEDREGVLREDAA